MAPLHPRSFLAFVCYLGGVLRFVSGRQTLLARESATVPREVLTGSQGSEFLAEREYYVAPFSYDHSLDFVLVIPEYKMLFCYIPKNACSEFNKLANEINLWPTSKRPGPWMHSSARDKGWNSAEIVEALRSDQWYKATVLRDPLRRLLSGYLSKCAAGEDGAVEDRGEHCLGYELHARRGRPPSFEEFIDNLDNAKLTDKGITDMHFREQTDFCGGLNISDYDFVGSLEQDLNPQVKEMLEGAAAFTRETAEPGGAFTPGQGLDLEGIQKRHELANKFFPPTGQTQTAAANSLTQASSDEVFSTHYTNPALIGKARAIYANDYRTLPQEKLRPLQQWGNHELANDSQQVQVPLPPAPPPPPPAEIHIRLDEVD